MKTTEPLSQVQTLLLFTSLKPRKGRISQHSTQWTGALPTPGSRLPEQLYWLKPHSCSRGPI